MCAFSGGGERLDFFVLRSLGYFVPPPKKLCTVIMVEHLAF